MARTPRLPRGGRVDSRGRSSRQRLGAIRRRRAFRRFGESFLDQMGFDAGDFKSGGIVKGKLGLFGSAISKKSRASDTGGLPPLKSARTEANKSNPTLTSIVDQLESLVKTAKKLGVITKDQQKALLLDINETRKVDKESFIENNDSGAELNSTGGISAEALAPLSTAIEKLAEKLGLLDKTLDDKLDEQDDDGNFASRFFDSLGFGDEYESFNRRRSARRARLASPENQRRQRISARESRASRFNPSQLLDSRGRRLSGAAMDSRLAALERARGSTSILSRFRSSVSTAGRGATRVARGGSTLVRSSLRRVAGPLIAKSLGRTVLKSIPFIGAAAGLGFALDRLVRGDVVGAGLDLASGLGGPFTALPLMAATIARDSYADVYGVQPEQDPESPKRLVEIKTATEDLIKETMIGQAVKKDKPSGNAIDNALIGDKIQTPPPPVQTETKAPPIPPATPPAIAKTPTSTGGGGGTPPPVPKPTSAPSAGAAGSTPKPKEPASQSIPSQNLSGTELKGSELNKQTLDVERMESGEDQSLLIPSSAPNLIPNSTGPTTKPGASGMGDVRSPYYDFVEMGTIPNQVYY